MALDEGVSNRDAGVAVVLGEVLDSVGLGGLGGLASNLDAAATIHKRGLIFG